MKKSSINIGRREFFNKGVKVAAATTLISPALQSSRAEAAEMKEQAGSTAPPEFIIDSIKSSSCSK